MTQGSSLPPLKKNNSKYGLIALLLLLAAGSLWVFLRTDDSGPGPDDAEPAVEAPTREQFAPEIEIPEDAAIPQGTEADEASTKSNPSRQTHPAETECLGTLAAAQIRDVINGPPRKQVQTCYERALKDNNLLQGSMKVLLTIGVNGSVTAVSVEGSLHDAQVYSCVRRVAKTWKFPEPQGGCVQTSLPFQMTPKL
ncbi:MAG: AgmX/PglI C-terminal domain-containing protein [Polyangiales bacterium]